MALRHILSILLLPGMVTIGVPYLILSSRRFGPPVWPADPLGPLGMTALLAGIVVIGSGLALVGATIRLFARVGRGTLAPWDPPRHLVVSGVYRHVRNPMISGVVLILVGEALLFRSLGVLAWAMAFLALNAVYFPLVEERGLERRFGDEYRHYKRHVPRWVPRRTAWTPPWTRDDGGHGQAR